MAVVVSDVTIDGPRDQVFDLVTTTKYWTQWHPATIGVGGVTERPVQLGDLVHEKARIGSAVYEGDWKVVEHTRPSRVVLRGEGLPVQITYTFTTVERGTHFNRALEFRPEDFAGSAVDPAAITAVMDRQSAEGMRKLKALV